MASILLLLGTRSINSSTITQRVVIVIVSLLLGLLYHYHISYFDLTVQDLSSHEFASIDCRVYLSSQMNNDEPNSDGNLNFYCLLTVTGITIVFLVQRITPKSHI